MARIEAAETMRFDTFAGSNGKTNGSGLFERENPYAQKHTGIIVKLLRNSSISSRRRQELIRGLNNLKKM